jgi:hypothetical protein
MDAYYEHTAAEDDPLPGIEGLRITGEPFPGQELRAGGYSINGTTTCNFEVCLTSCQFTLQVAK